ncbi:MAG: type II 3-dehydroquinate dehydratase [Alphaproteobacteria bacterium]|nr:type II 3-dehydroquinate dehydratase [Alphaproteobacteria bacterium]OJV13124.1 MAG: type II 3-dehydroquinate dehydratase [Alphaproteobacteria bacterium 33-17]
MQKVMIINGPNLNLLGQRDPEIYGYDTLFDIEEQCKDFADKNNMAIDFRQSNSEGEIIDWIHEARNFNAVIINAAAYSHTSIAIMDALEILTIPVIEVHMSNIYKRESFRYNSYVSKVASGVISGFGAYGYIMALNSALELTE